MIASEWLFSGAARDLFEEHRKMKARVEKLEAALRIIAQPRPVARKFNFGMRYSDLQKIAAEALKPDE